MLRSLQEYPHYFRSSSKAFLDADGSGSQAHRVEEWLLSLLVEPAFQVAERTGLFSRLRLPFESVDELIEQSHFDPRCTRCILQVLLAAGVLELRDGRYIQRMHSVPDVFHQIALALQTLQQSIEDGLFAAVSEDGALPAHASETLIWLGIARREDERLVLTEAGRRYFVPNQECYLGQYVCSMRKVLLHIITRLESLLKTGQTETSQKPEVLKSLVSLLYPLHQEEAQQVADTLFKRGEVKRVLDLGTGSGVWSIALARKKRDIRVDALDVPAVLESTRAFAKRCKVLSQFRFTDGDLLQTETWGEPPYDVIYLGYVCNGCSAADNQRILTACAQYLRPGGHLVLADYCADQMGTLLPALHALFQATLAREGGIYAAETYSGWCQEAGFSELEQRSVSAGVALFLARAAASQEHQEAVAVGATVAE